MLGQDAVVWTAAQEAATQQAVDACKSDSNWRYGLCMWKDWDSCANTAQAQDRACLQNKGFNAADASAIAGSWRVLADAKRLQAIALTTQPASITVPSAAPSAAAPASPIPTAPSAAAPTYLPPTAADDRRSAIVMGLVVAGIVGTVAYLGLRRR